MERHRSVNRVLATGYISVGCLLLWAGMAKADFGFRQAEIFDAGLNGPGTDFVGDVSSDGLEIYATTDYDGKFTSPFQILRATRGSTEDEWGPFEPLGPNINSTGPSAPTISPDGLELYYTDFRSDGLFIYVSTRKSFSDPWGPGVKLTQFGGGHGNPIVQSPFLSGDGSELYFTIVNKSDGFGSQDIYVSKRLGNAFFAWGEPENIGAPINTEYSEGHVSISSDGLALFYSEHINTFFPAGSGLVNPDPSGNGRADVWVSTRKSKDEPWGTARNAGLAINTNYADYLPVISPDGSTLYFVTERDNPGGPTDAWIAEVVPFVDFNSDGMVDLEDLLILLDHWGTDEPSVDIGPMPWGDGVVDGKDVDALMKYWMQPFVNPEPLVPMAPQEPPENTGTGRQRMPAQQ